MNLLFFAKVPEDPICLVFRMSVPLFPSPCWTTRASLISTDQPIGSKRELDMFRMNHSTREPFCTDFNSIIPTSMRYVDSPGLTLWPFSSRLYLTVSCDWRQLDFPSDDN